MSDNSLHIPDSTKPTLELNSVKYYRGYNFILPGYAECFDPKWIIVLSPDNLIYLARLWITRTGEILACYARGEQ